MAGVDLFSLAEAAFAEPEAPPPAVERPPLRVSQLAAVVKGTLENFGPLRVEGEISSAKLHSSGHFYADLKDEGAVLNLVAWRDTVRRWGNLPKAGDQVVVTGTLTSYPARSTYQLRVEKIELAGLGALLRQLEELKQRLAAEGLFDADRKRDLPLLPKRIGIVTSPTGAVIQDMLHRLRDRGPRPVILWPAAVQGANAAQEVAAGIAGLNALPEDKRPDVIIVARGGGSLEDLMAFNSEAVVRAVAASAVPVISGVGHEPDVTLCDLAADVRAPTPTAAAEYVVPVAADLLGGIAELQRQLALGLRRRVLQARERVGYLARLLPDPRRQVLQAQQQLDDLGQRLATAAQRDLAQRQQKLEALGRVLLAHNPHAPLTRGYAFVTTPAGAVVRQASAAAGRLKLHFADGQRDVEVVG